MQNIEHLSLSFQETALLAQQYNLQGALKFREHQSDVAASGRFKLFSVQIIRKGTFWKKMEFNFTFRDFLRRQFEDNVFKVNV